jgi:hypothetical protein
MVGFGEGEGDKVTFGVVALVEIGVGEVAVFEVGVGVGVTVSVGVGVTVSVGVGVTVSVGVGVTVSVGVGVGDVSSDVKVAMQPAQEVDKKFVPEFAVSLVVDILVNSASDTYVPNACTCPLDKA